MPVVWKFGCLDLLETSGPVQASKGLLALIVHTQCIIIAKRPSVAVVSQNVPPKQQV